jgi:hypothetical protein
MISPLSLSNVLTVLVALLCLWTMSPQARGGVLRIWRLGIPACFAAVEALMLLAGVFDATFAHDAEWVIGLAIGAVLGRMRGWTMTVAVDHARALVRLPRASDGRLAAVAMVVLSGIDFVSSLLEDSTIEPQYVAAAAALFAGYIGGRALALVVRSQRSPHVELHSTAPDNAYPR